MKERLKSMFNFIKSLSKVLWPSIKIVIKTLAPII